MLLDVSEHGIEVCVVNGGSDRHDEMRDPMRNSPDSAATR